MSARHSQSSPLTAALRGGRPQRCQGAHVSASSKLVPGPGQLGSFLTTLLARLGYLAASPIAMQACKVSAPWVRLPKEMHGERGAWALASSPAGSPPRATMRSGGSGLWARGRHRESKGSVEGTEQRLRGLQPHRLASKDARLHPGDKWGHLGWQPAAPGSTPGLCSSLTLCLSLSFPSKNSPRLKCLFKASRSAGHNAKFPAWPQRDHL